MQIQIIGIKKCKDTQKALRFFLERGLKPHFVDLNEKSLTKGELINISSGKPIEDLIDKEGAQYKKRNLEYMVFDASNELLKDPLLLSMPIVRSGKKSIIGYNPTKWQEMADEAKKP